jgi:hypothetical protein
MKTTIEIADGLFAEARKLAQREGSTLRALIEEGLRRIIGERRRREGFQLRKASFRGKGLSPELKDASWDEIRERVYEGRGE